jgi:hypothetical protein
LNARLTQITAQRQFPDLRERLILSVERTSTCTDGISDRDLAQGAFPLALKPLPTVQQRFTASADVRKWLSERTLTNIRF